MKSGQVSSHELAERRWSLLVEVGGAEQLVLLDAVSTIAPRR